MAIKLKSGKQFERAVELLKELTNLCPKCLSDNIANEDSEDQYTCHDCSSQFTEAEQMDKTVAIAYLKLDGLSGPAREIQNMEQGEYDDFLTNHVY
jgi:5-methylcytosine-specific restriction endonuclease McrA